MLKRKAVLLGLLVSSVLILAACSSPTEEPIAIEPSSEELMEDEPMDEEMSEGDTMEDEAMDEEMMDEEMTDEETMDEPELSTFIIRIENVGGEDGLTILSPGAYELNDHPVSFFTAGEADRGLGLETLAEDGDPSVLVASIGEMMGDDMMSFAVDAFAVPVGAEGPGPAGPGSAYEFEVEAYPGQYLTFATMFVQSNDWFFAPDERGIELFNADGTPLSGDITDLIFLWNAGTEIDQTPGEGVDQAPRQAGPDTGEAEGGLVSRVDDFTNYQILVTITPQS